MSLQRNNCYKPLFMPITSSVQCTNESKKEREKDYFTYASMCTVFTNLSSTSMSSSPQWPIPLSSPGVYCSTTGNFRPAAM